MSAEASGPAAAGALSLEAPKPWGLEPGSAAAAGLQPQTPNSKYVKLNVGGSLHYTTLRTLTGQDTLLKAMFSGRAEVLTDAGGTARPYLCCPPPSGSPPPALLVFHRPGSSCPFPLLTALQSTPSHILPSPHPISSSLFRS